MNKSDYDVYHKKGGDYIIPVEVFNELFDEIEELQAKASYKKDADILWNRSQRFLREIRELKEIKEDAIDKLYRYEEVLDENFKKEMLKTLMGED